MKPHYKSNYGPNLVILIGDCRVGKTSFLNCIINKKMNSSAHNVPPTIGVEYAPTHITIRGEEIKINLWDTSGAEQYKSITSSYYRKCQGAIIMFDLTDAGSFESLEHWVRELDRKGDPKLQKIIIANKLDLVESGQKERKVSEKQILDFCMRHSLSFRETSAFTGQNIYSSFSDLVEKIHEAAQNGNFAQPQMGSQSLENNPDWSQLPHENEKAVALGDKDGSGSCPKCC